MSGISLVSARFVVYQLERTSAFGPSTFTGLVLVKTLLQISRRASIPMAIFKALKYIYIPHVKSVAGQRLFTNSVLHLTSINI